jgi:hypothetical protein
MSLAGHLTPLRSRTFLFSVAATEPSIALATEGRNLFASFVDPPTPMNDQTASLIRTAFKTGGAVLASRGVGDSSGWELVGGAVVFLAGLLMSYVHHKNNPTIPTP